MRRRARARLAVAATVAATCAALFGCAGSSNTTSATGTPSTTSTTSAPSTPSTGPSALSVSPASGTPQSVIRFNFSSPPRAAQASTQISQALSIVGPRHGGCVGVHDEPVPVAPAGQAVHVTVGPAQLGGAWCPGTYAARVEVLARPKCGAGVMCPQFIRVVAVLGPVTFRIAG